MLSLVQLFTIPRILYARKFPGKNSGVACHFPTPGHSWHRDWTRASCTACRFFTVWATLSNKWINEWMAYFDCHLEPNKTASLEFAIMHFCLLFCVLRKFFFLFLFLPREHTGHSKQLFSNNPRNDSTHGHHQTINIRIRLIMFFAA